MVSVSLPGSDTRMVEIIVSYGRLGESLTYFSNSDTTLPISVSMSGVSSTLPSIGSSVATRKPSSSRISTTLPRVAPSTRSLMLPFGSFRLWTMFAMVPMKLISSGFGSSILASRCVARKIRLSPRSAFSTATREDLRPTTNGIIVYGNTTTSRSGTSGRTSVFWPRFSIPLII